nr:MAG TPA: hypothetical protein [Caudoviricetes sp.]
MSALYYLTALSILDFKFLTYSSVFTVSRDSSDGCNHLLKLAIFSTSLFRALTYLSRYSTSELILGSDT